MTALAVSAASVVPTLLQLGGNFIGLALLFFVLAIIAAVVGFRDVAGISMQVAKILIFVFLVLAVISLLL